MVLMALMVLMVQKLTRPLSASRNIEQGSRLGGSEKLEKIGGPRVTYQPLKEMRLRQPVNLSSRRMLRLRWILLMSC